MTTVVLAIVIATLVGALVWMMHTANKRVDEVLAGSDMLSKTRDELEQANVATSESRFEIAQIKMALASEKARADALEDYVSHDAKETDAHVPLAPDDVASRVLRLSQRWGAAVPAGTSASSSVPAVAGGAVHDAPAAGTSGDGDVHKSGPQPG